MIEVKCLGCGQKIKVKDELAGKRGKCPSCGDPLQVPATSAKGPAAAAPPPASPSPSTPTPVPSRPPRPSSPETDFVVVNPIVAADPAGSFAELHAPSAADAEDGVRERTTRRKGRSSPARWATRAAIVGAIGGGLVLAVLQPSDGPLIKALQDVLGKLIKGITEETIRGVLVGLICGLMLGCTVMGVTGRSDEGVVGAFVLLIGASVYGGFRGATPFEMSWALLLLGTLTGIMVGAIVGAVFGAILAAASG